MSTGNLPAPKLITQPEQLHRLAGELMRQPIVAVDTESNSLFAYQEQVCLVQFSTPQTDYLVDPLTLADLSPLAPLFSSPKIEKIFHAAEYDVICLRRDFGFSFNNLFDTMVAARILGREAVGLGAMLESEFGVRVNKRYQRANWGERPLPAKMLDYARLDTHYLIELRSRLRAALKTNGLWPLAEEDFTRLCSYGLEKDNEAGHAQTGHKNGAGEKHIDPWRVSGAHDLPPQQAAVLQELCRYRDGRAQALNRPLFKVIGDRTLIAIANEMPESLDELAQLPGMSYKQVRRHGNKLLRAVRAGLRTKPIYPPRAQRRDNGFVERLEALRNWRKKTARDMGVMSDIVLPRDLLYLLAEANPADRQTLQELLKEAPWRLKKYGPQILAVLGDCGG